RLEDLRYGPPHRAIVGSASRACTTKGFGAAAALSPRRRRERRRVTPRARVASPCAERAPRRGTQERHSSRDACALAPSRSPGGGAERIGGGRSALCRRAPRRF